MIIFTWPRAANQSHPLCYSHIDPASVPQWQATTKLLREEGDAWRRQARQRWTPQVGSQLFVEIERHSERIWVQAEVRQLPPLHACDCGKGAACTCITVCIDKDESFVQSINLETENSDWVRSTPAEEVRPPQEALKVKEYVRPPPPPSPPLEVGQAAEVWRGRGWRVGVVREVEGELIKVAIDDEIVVVRSGSSVRLAREWRNGSWTKAEAGDGDADGSSSCCGSHVEANPGAEHGEEEGGGMEEEEPVEVQEDGEEGQEEEEEDA